MRLKKRLLGTSILEVASVAMMVGSAAAQDVPASLPQEPDEDQAVAVEEVVVTGTRLRIPDYEGSNPVASVSGEALEYAGITNVTDFLTDQPALVSSTTLQDNSNAGNRASVGLNLLNLRGLGTQRTLVLVNGRRHVGASAGDTAVDINSIPVALIDRIDVLTGGASATYGADGVSGVVNFILKNDFEGVDARVQYGASEDGGGENAFFSLLAGDNFADDQANVTFGVEYSNTARVAREDRDFASLAGAETVVVNPNYGEPGEYRRIFARNVRYIDTSPGGSVYADVFLGSIFGDPGSLSGVDFTGDGMPFDDGLYTSGFSMIGGDGSQLAAFQTDLVPELERIALNSTFDFEITPNHHFFGELKYVQTNTQFQSQPSFDYALFVPIDNPYIPQPIYDVATGPLGIANLIDGVLVARDNFDLGYILRDVKRETYRGVVGFRGDINDHLSYEVSLNYGRTNENNLESNNRINERWFAAIDAVVDPSTGDVVCRSDLDPTAAPLGTFPGFGDSGFDQSTFGTTFTPGANSGCIPINIFGEGNASAEALDWILTESESRDQVEQFVFQAFVSGDTEPYFNLWGGPVAYALGVEYREEKALSIPSFDEIMASQIGYDVTWLGEGTPLAGEFDVTEVFGEASLPIVRDLPFVSAFTIDMAYRYSDYSTAGETDTWKLGAIWSINDSVTLRSTQARSVRAPNISELFLPLSQTFAGLADPCDDDNYTIGINPEIREANCRALLGLGPNDPYTFNNITSSSVEGVIGGNQDLAPEEADTFTAGIVLTPTFLRGLSVALDYYDIELENAIQFFSAQSIVNKCYDLPQPNQFCDLVSRDPTTNFIDFFEQFGVNVAEYTTSGWDLSLDYTIDPADFGIMRDIGRFGIGLTANKLEELTFTEDPSDPLSSDETVGQAWVPEWQATLDLTWEWNRLLVNYGYNWFDETRRYEGVPDDFIDPAYINFSERSTHDIQARYELKDGASIYGGVNNIGDQKPDRARVDYPVGPLGRFYYIGLKMTM